VPQDGTHIQNGHFVLSNRVAQMDEFFGRTMRSQVEAGQFPAWLYEQQRGSLSFLNRSL
jgi:hypothetical protein